MQWLLWQSPSMLVAMVTLLANMTTTHDRYIPDVDSYTWDCGHITIIIPYYTSYYYILTVNVFVSEA